MSKVILVTGASRGIGAATARLAAERGYSVCVNYRRNREAAEGFVNAIEGLGARAVAVQADMAVEADVTRLFETCDKALGPLAALVNNAGILETQMRVDAMDGARLMRVFATNIVGPFLCAREAIRRMSTRRGGGGGAIVNVSSGASRLGSPGEYVDYAASKGAIDTFTIGLAREVAEEGVRVNAVRAGFISTDIHASGGEPNRVDRVKAFVPMKRGGTRKRWRMPFSGCSPTRRRTPQDPSSTSLAENRRVTETMNDEQTFRAILVIGFLIVMPIGIYHRIRFHAPREPLDRRKEGLFILATLRPIGLILWVGLIAYMVNPASMAWSSLPLPAWQRWIGVGIFAAGGALLVWTLRSLGKNLTDTVVTRREHTLVSTGPYRWVRHPFYDSAALFLLGASLVAANWFLFGVGIMALALLVVRTRREEEQLIARFGDAYRAYMNRTGRFLPVWILLLAIA